MFVWYKDSRRGRKPEPFLFDKISHSGMDKKQIYTSCISNVLTVKMCCKMRLSFNFKYLLNHKGTV